MGIIGNLASKLRRDVRGNALIFVAAGAPLLIGGAGFAVDTAQWYMWKRELQHAVDQAAYAGAWARADEDSEDTYAIRAQQEYDANVAKVEGFDATPTITLANFGDGTLNSVVVESSATRALPFTSFFTGSATTVRARAQATFQEGINYNACIVSLREAGTGTSIGGSSTVRARCGLAALSCSDDAIVIDGSSEVVTDSIAACGTIDVDGDEELEAVSAEGITDLADLYADLEPPTDDTQRVYKCSSGRNKQASPLPGTYAGLVTKCDTVFAPGIYVIDGGTLDLTHNSSLTGNGVMFVLKNGATLKLGGSGNSNAINLTPMTASQFVGTPYESVKDDLAGIMIFEHRDNNPSQTHILNGNSNTLIEGLVYLPDGDLRVNGTADIAAQCLKVSAYTINVIGGAFLETLCPTDDPDLEVGRSLADVRLVA